MSSLALSSPRPEAARACAHCGLPSGGERFCCAGCETVHGLLEREGFLRYYELGQGTRPGDGERVERVDNLWLESEQARLAESKGLRRVELDVQGMHCSACVWLFQEMFRREGARGRVLASPMTGRCELTIDETFPLSAFVGKLSRFGYRFGPARAERDSELLWRLGVCVAIAMNTMIFAIAMYAGLEEGPLYTLFRRLDLGLSVLAVAVGGPVFFRSAWASLKRRVFHLDLPIALGIALAFASSVHGYVVDAENGSYFDTLNVFIALMLAGRFLQERALEKSRNYLLGSDGAQDLLARRLGADAAAVEIVACTELRRDDVLLLAPGDLLPARGKLLAPSATLSLDWVSGEAEPVEFAFGEEIPAGAFSNASKAISVQLLENFADSSLPVLLRNEGELEPTASRFWHRYVRAYVTLTLLTAVVTFVAWTLMVDVWRAFEVVAGVLIITCPCAVGIAVPLAYQLAHAGLRRRGLFVRRAGFLDRLLTVRQVVFDKTGTLTTGRLRLKSEAPLDALDAASRETLYNLAIRSAHPKSAVLVAALEARGARYVADVHAEEHVGLGVEHDGFRLGAPSWALRLDAGAFAASHGCDVVFAKNGTPLASFDTEEVLRVGAERDLSTLAALGLRLGILSGDTSSRVASLSARFGDLLDFAVGNASPSAKQRWIEDHEPSVTLMIGDGVNDAPALAKARCSGTPALDRPLLAARCDFFFTGARFDVVALAFRIARALRRTTTFVLTLGVLYNVVGLSLAVTGHMSPLLCAVLMPATSISLVLITTRALAQGASPWRS